LISLRQVKMSRTAATPVHEHDADSEPLSPFHSDRDESNGVELPRSDCSSDSDAYQCHHESSASSATEKHFLPAVKLNNNGAALLAANQFDLATKTLRDAVGSFEMAIAVLQKPPGLKQDELWREYLSISRLAVAKAEMRTAFLPKSDGEKELTREGSFDWLIYTKPISLSASMLPGYIFAATLFNLGLANHLKGSLLGRQKYVDEAVNLYRMSESTLLHITRSASCPNNEDIDSTAQVAAFVAKHLSKALMNNMGQICLEWGRHEWGKEYFEGLDCVCGYKQRQCTEGDAPVFAETYEFMFNALVVGRLNTAPVA